MSDYRAFLARRTQANEGDGFATGVLRGPSLRPDSLKILIFPKDRSHPCVPYSWTADQGAAVGSQRSEVGAAHTGTRTGARRPERRSC